MLGACRRERVEELDRALVSAPSVRRVVRLELLRVGPQLVCDGAEHAARLRCRRVDQGVPGREASGAEHLAEVVGAVDARFGQARWFLAAGVDDEPVVGAHRLAFRTVCRSPSTTAPSTTAVPMAWSRAQSCPPEVVACP